ncbi:amidohydrolase family protein [Bradyrhizobium sp. USDA 4473]
MFGVLLEKTMDGQRYIDWLLSGLGWALALAFFGWWIALAIGVVVGIGTNRAEPHLTAESLPRIAEKYHETVRPGFYARILDLANIKGCHVNSLQRIFMETEQPGLLDHDISILQLCRCSAADFAWVEAETGRRPTTLDEWLEVIDLYFTTYGAKAVAVKSQIAYSRALDFAPVAKAHAARLFPHHADRAGALHALGPEDLKALQDYLFRYCVGKAGEYGLPVKLHTGVLAGYGVMQLARTRGNAADVCRLLQEFPETRFVLMHIGYPYEHDLSHWPNISLTPRSTCAGHGSLIRWRAFAF